MKIVYCKHYEFTKVIKEFDYIVDLYRSCGYLMRKDKK